MYRSPCTGPLHGIITADTVKIYRLVLLTVEHNGFRSRPILGVDFFIHAARDFIRISRRRGSTALKSRYSQFDIIKIKIHSSCEIEDFVETHLCKLCVILRSRALRVVCPH